MEEENFPPSSCSFAFIFIFISTFADILFIFDVSTFTGAHGDFHDGWKDNVLQSAINKCPASDGNIRSCTVLKLGTGVCQKVYYIPHLIYRCFSNSKAALIN